MLLMSEKIDKVLPALIKVKSTVKALVKKSDNPFYKSKYVDLNAHLDEVEPLLEANGLVLFQPPIVQNSNNTVTTVVFHGESGQYFGANILVPMGLDAQKTGASITYFRRFGLNALLALKSVDDDGEEAVGRGKASKPAAAQSVVAGTNGTSPSAVKVTTGSDTTTAAKPSFRRPAKATVVKAAAPETTSSGDDL